jgi:SAM-dependent methyltransferase
VDIKKALSIVYLPAFVRDWISYRNQLGKPLHLVDSMPCLSDRLKATPYDPHYLFQSAWLSRELNAFGAADWHTDVGSDVRMIATVSAFIKVRFIDLRPLQVALPNLSCVAASISRLPFRNETLRSVSSLHVIEHIGLGRYGDLLNARGSEEALAELARTVASGGRLYISVPVGRERVCFNAHRVLLPQTVIKAVQPLKLISFSLVDDLGHFVSPAPIEAAATLDYGCGMFVFERSEFHS